MQRKKKKKLINFKKFSTYSVNKSHVSFVKTEKNVNKCT